MLTITLRDLQYRKRQFAIAIVGAALTFALALLLTGSREGFNTEAADTVGAVNADGWVLQEGVSGPFTSVSGLPAATAERIEAAPGVDQAAAFVASPNTIKPADGELLSVNMVGVEAGKIGSPEVDSGEMLSVPGKAVVSDKAGLSLGDTFSMSGEEFEVAGIVNDRTYFGGSPVIYLSMADAQELAFGGRPLSNAIVYSGEIAEPPQGLSLLTNADVEEDMKRVLGGAIATIDLVRLLMWIVSAVIIGAVIYLSALERLRDFAVLEAVGTEARSLAFGISLQAVIASLIAALLAVGFAMLLRPVFTLPVTINLSAYLMLVGVAVVVGVIASLAALRRVLKVDPALAFG